MIYRNWSLLSSTVVIWGGVATAGLAGIFLFGGKLRCKPEYLDTKNQERLLDDSGPCEGPVCLRHPVGLRRLVVKDLRFIARLEKFQNYLSREGERLRQQDRAAMGKN
uniref:Uncharacterized protein n=1 Tax=Oryza punctata TaxID=4537 RepID=A0A0E0L761_ORYPU